MESVFSLEFWWGSSPPNWKSPYLDDPRRLANVIAALQATGLREEYQLPRETWVYYITGDKADPIRIRKWKSLLADHPEFFRTDRAGNVHLIMRRQFERRRFEDTETKTRRVLSESELGKLIEVAITLHLQAVDKFKDRRWWFAPVIAFSGVIIGAYLGYLAKK